MLCRKYYIGLGYLCQWLNIYIDVEIFDGKPHQPNILEKPLRSECEQKMVRLREASYSVYRGRNTSAGRLTQSETLCQ